MKIIKLSHIIILLTFLSISFPSCNKDEIIEAVGPDNPDSTGFRPITPQSSGTVDRVFEWTPAPGQYINDFGSTFDGDHPITSEEAAQWAFERLSKRQFVSLGAFGGYIISGFDHSIKNIGDYEIGVFGNAFLSQNGCSDEPGIVYVMKDTNGNGLPDDIWYELKGSDTFAEGTIWNYQVTYYKPAGDEKPVKWSDNLGNTGEISYLGAFHKQSSYYPEWIDSETYTLCGTCLEAKTCQNPETGNWENPPFEWGYADNIGEDNIELDGIKNCNRFRISDAIDKDGNPVNLDFIDFVKVQTGVSATAGWLGEVSTEVLGIIDLSLIKE